MNRVIDGPNQLWEFDIKHGYIHGQNRFFYVLAFIDVFIRKVINYHIGLTCKGKAMLNNFVLMETNRSRHTSSLEHPRIILFGVDARMMIGITTDSDDPNYNTLELMEFQEANKS